MFAKSTAPPLLAGGVWAVRRGPTDIFHTLPAASLKSPILTALSLQHLVQLAPYSAFLRTGMRNMGKGTQERTRTCAAQVILRIHCKAGGRRGEQSMTAKASHDQVNTAFRQSLASGSSGVKSRLFWYQGRRVPVQTLLTALQIKYMIARRPGRNIIGRAMYQDTVDETDRTCRSDQHFDTIFIG